MEGEDVNAYLIWPTGTLEPFKLAVTNAQYPDDVIITKLSDRMSLKLYSKKAAPFILLQCHIFDGKYLVYWLQLAPANDEIEQVAPIFLRSISENPIGRLAFRTIWGPCILVKRIMKRTGLDWDVEATTIEEAEYVLMTAYKRSHATPLHLRQKYGSKCNCCCIL